MEPALNWAFFSGVLSIIIINIVLSGDNAAVIGMAIRNLPHDQRKLAAVLGAGGAVVLRIVFTCAATILIRIPWVQTLGGLLLLWITYKLIVGSPEDNRVGSTGNLWKAVGIIIMADLSMSFDNVLGVAGAAQGNIWLVVFGLVTSIPILVWGSSWLANLMDRYPIIIYIGGAVLAHTAATLVYKGLGITSILALNISRIISWSLAVAIIVWGIWATTKQKDTNVSH